MCGVGEKHGKKDPVDQTRRALKNHLWLCGFTDPIRLLGRGSRTEKSLLKSDPSYPQAECPALGAHTGALAESGHSG